MFIYLLIACELAILFYAYWLVYLKEPSIYKVDADAWGIYPGRKQKKDSGQKMHLTFSDKFPGGFKSELIGLKKP